MMELPGRLPLFGSTSTSQHAPLGIVTVLRRRWSDHHTSTDTLRRTRTRTTVLRTYRQQVIPRFLK